MSTKENFVKALRELTGFDDDGQTSGAKPQEEIKVKKLEPIKFEFENKVEPPVASADITKKVYDDSKRHTSITSGMVVKGKIESSSMLEVFGRIEGDVAAKGDLVVGGAVLGDVQAKNLLLQKCAIKGDIVANGDITVETGSVIIGDIMAENIKLDGKVKGDIVIKQMAELMTNALVSGNIETTSISTSRGSRIKGSIVTRQANNFDDDAEFDIEV